MGQKVNPIAFRLAANKNWRSTWAIDDKKKYQNRLLEDIQLRRFLKERLKLSGLVKTTIERSFNRMKIILLVTRPGVVIGRGGKNLEILKKELCGMISLKQSENNLEIAIEEVEEANLSAVFIAERIASQLENRMRHRRVIQKELDRVMQAGAEGIKIRLAGRIDGATIGRCEKFSKGAVPTSTIRAEIEFAQRAALTRKGYIGIKVWIYPGEK